MTLKEFKNLRRIINLAVKELEERAFKEGTIDKKEFEDAVLKLKKMIVERAGFGFGEYQEFIIELKKISSGRAGISFEEYQELEKDKEEIIKNEVSVIKKEIKGIKKGEDLKREIEEIVKKNPPKIINKTNIIKEVEKPKIIREIKTDKKGLENIQKDILYLQEELLDFENEIKKLNSEIRSVEGRIINEGAIMEKVENLKKWSETDDKLGLIRQTISRMTWGFDEQIKSLRADITTESLWDRTGTTLSPQNANDSVDLGSGNLTTTGSIKNNADNSKHYWGAADDWSLTFDGTNFTATREVGTGYFDVPLINIPNTTNSTTGIIFQNGSSFIHTYTNSLAQTEQNVFIGYNAGNFTFSNATNGRNVGIGYNALHSLTTGINNVALGRVAGDAITTAQHNMLIGTSAGGKLTTGGSNIAIGTFALNAGVSSINNTIIGRNAYQLGTNHNNVVIGAYALDQATTGTQNTIIGTSAAGTSGVDPDANVVIGYQAGYNLTGDNNVFIGKQVGYNETGSNLLYIDNSNTATPLIKGDFSARTITLGEDNTKLQFGTTVTDLQIFSDGTDGEIDTTGDLYLNTTGNVKFGTHTAIGAETITGYITIKDSGGTLRKLAVVS